MEPEDDELAGTLCTSDPRRLDLELFDVRTEELRFDDREHAHRLDVIVVAGREGAHGWG
jgi:hypothetical protein